MSFALSVLLLLLVFAVCGLAAALLQRHLGLISIGHAAVVGTAAYAYATISIAGLSRAIGVGGALLASVALGAAIVVLSSRLIGEDFALATFAVQLVWFGFVANGGSVTGGSLGISGIQQLIPTSRADPLPAMVAVGLCLLGLSLWSLRLSQAGGFAIASAVVARSEELARTLGIPAVSIRLQIGALYGLLLGCAGILLASYLSFIDPPLFATDISVLILAIGFFGSFAPPSAVVLGSFVIVAVPQTMRLLGLAAAQAGALETTLSGLVVACSLLIWTRRRAYTLV